MAKKKNRQLNIAHKRAKRQQEQKSRHKQLTLRKQRLLQNTKSDEERLQDKIVKSRLLVDEPELENVTFDQHLLRQHVLELLEFQMSSLADRHSQAAEEAPVSAHRESEGDDEENEVDDEDELTPEDEDDHQSMSEKFRCEVLPLLITPDFIRTVLHALKACETRLKLIGHREKAEIAFVARSLFELADPDTLVFHPLIVKICARTLERMLNQPQFTIEGRDAVQNVLSDVLKLGKAEDTVDEQRDVEVESVEDSESHGFEISINSILNPAQEGSDETEEGAANEEAEPMSDAPTVADRDLGAVDATEIGEAKPVSDAPTVSPENLSAKALYKNCNGLETRQAIEVGNGYRIVKETNQQVEFVHVERQHYITLTAERLLLQCSSKAQLEAAMKEVEERCGQSLFYLARTVDEK